MRRDHDTDQPEPAASANEARATPWNGDALSPLARALILIGAVMLACAAMGGVSVRIGLDAGTSVILGACAGSIIGCALALLVVALPEERRARDRRELVRRIEAVFRLQREQGPELLEDIDEMHELRGLADVVRAVIDETRRDRFEAARLRREMDARVHSETRRATARISKEAETDELTRLLNRRGLMRRFNQLVDLHATEPRHTSVLAIDLDHFKQLNDTCGHAAGDDALRAVGEVIRANTREGDIAARIGGDEFILVLDRATPERARAVARRIMELHASHPGHRRANGSWPGLSIGLASTPPERPLLPDQLIKRADKALYAGKHNGRRRCMSYEQALREHRLDPET